MNWPERRRLNLYAEKLTRIINSAWDKEGIDQAERNRRIAAATARIRRHKKKSKERT